MQIPKDLKKYQLRSPVAPKRRRLVATTDGDSGCGKTRFAVKTAPKPLCIVNLDKSLEAYEEDLEGQDVLIHDVEMPEAINQKKDLESFLEARNLVLDAIKSGDFKTIFLDTGCSMWELCRRGFIGALDFGSAQRQDYAEPNGAMRRMFRAARDAKGVNLVISHRSKEEREEYVNEKGKTASRLTGEIIMSGWRHTKFESQIHLHFERDKKYVCPHKGKCKRPDLCRLDAFSAEITNCTLNESLIGTVLRGTEIDFKRLGMLVFPSTEDTPEVWEDE